MSCQHPIPRASAVPKTPLPTYTRTNRFLAERKSTGLAIPNFHPVVQSENHTSSPCLWKVHKERSNTHPILPCLTSEEEEACSTAPERGLWVWRKLHGKCSVEVLGCKVGFGRLQNCCGRIQSKSSSGPSPYWISVRKGPNARWFFFSFLRGNLKFKESETRVEISCYPCIKWESDSEELSQSFVYEKEF